MPGDYCVYEIRCAASGKLYVGLTRAGVRKRFNAHRYNALTGRPGVLYAAIRKYGIETFSVSTIAAGLDLAAACALEMEEIVLRGSLTPDGYNVTIGGEGTQGYKASADTKARMSAAHKARQADPELRARTSAALKGKPKSLEHNAKVSAALMGKTLSAETRAKITASLTGKTRSPEALAKFSAAMTGRKLAPEHARMIGDRSRGVPKSPEHRAKLSAALKGRKREARGLV